MENQIKQYVKRRAKRRFFLWLFGSFTGLITIGITLFVTIFLILAAGSIDNSESDSGSGGEVFTGEYTEGIPIFNDIKGRGPFSNEIAQYAVGAAVKYKLLPSVILSQYGYESAFGTSLSARNDLNFFGITWFNGCLFPKGTPRGIGGSEGGWYMKFPNAKAAFSFYGFMVATQSNFNACVGNKSPAADLLILGRGGYAAAGITEDSPYFSGCMSIISSNKLTEYDMFAIKHWGEGGNSGGPITGEWTNPFPGSSLDKSSFSGGQLFGTNPGGEFRPNGFHDGLDFGSIDHPGSEIHAVHGGKVVYVGNPGITGLGACVIVINDCGLNMVYQEFANGTGNAKVKEGELVKVGQVIATRDTAHLHLGITRMDWRQAEGHAFTNDGTWIDPLPLLTSNKK
ncbi:glucosaminidase domain-containing protein [Enterococcus faecium]|nr:peptidoglycan DD-metalloendopeptidase family protein [Enterococcus faecium]EGP5602384.1 peptidase M23 [Enterococcus faecium]EME7096372.1 glucosaminidase domain-containing protein [Enterococcus faecium]EME7159413.1 glucosaminidase domain-containing protein [Enterococcus faecium]EMF0589730.1 glucosaminidase domain-containing protein [Enterococcus faecium]